MLAECPVSEPSGSNTEDGDNRRSLDSALRASLRMTSKNSMLNVTAGQ
jgi:hypothetical protein